MSRGTSAPCDINASANWTAGANQKREGEQAPSASRRLLRADNSSGAAGKDGGARPPWLWQGSAMGGPTMVAQGCSDALLYWQQPEGLSSALCTASLPGAHAVSPQPDRGGQVLGGPTAVSSTTSSTRPSL